MQVIRVEGSPDGEPSTANRSGCYTTMSMMRTQEYFAPLRSRHISLQQWERGQLFDTFGHQGFGDRRSCTANRRQRSEGNIDRYIDSSASPLPAHAESDKYAHSHQVRPVKKVIARSLSLSAATVSGSNHKNVGGSEILDAKQLQANNDIGFRRGLSFSRSLTSSGEIHLVQELEELEEEPNRHYHKEACTVATVAGSNSGMEFSTSNCEPQKTPIARLLVSASMSSSMECFGSELQEMEGNSSLRSVNSSSKSNQLPAMCDRNHASSRSWPRKFFSGGLLFSKDRKFFSGVLPLTKSFGRNPHGIQGWMSANGIPSSPFHKGSSCCTIQDGRFRRNNFLTRMLSFSRSLDPRGEPSAKNNNDYDESPSKVNDMNSRFLGKRLSFSRSFDPSGELSPDVYDDKRTADPFQALEIEEHTNILRRYPADGLSFSRSLDPGGEIVSDDEEHSKAHDTCSKTQPTINAREFLESGRSLSSPSDINVCSESTSVSSTSDATSGDSADTAGSRATHKAPELSWSKKLMIMTSRSGFFFSKSLDPKKFKENSSDQHASFSFVDKDPTEPRPPKSSIFNRGFSLSFPRFLDPIADSTSDNASNSGHFQKDKKESRFKRFFTRGLFSFGSKASEIKTNASVPAAKHPASAISGPFSADKDLSHPAVAPRKLSFRGWSTTWSKGRNPPSSSQSAQLLSSVVNSAGSSSAAPPVRVTSKTHDLSSAATASKGGTGFSTSFPSLKNSRVLKYWWSRRGSPGHSVTSKSTDKHSRLVFLEKKPPARQQAKEDDNLTVYVGERGGTLTKCVLAKQILRHHLFQVLLKCSQDELGSDYDYNSGVPIICDPALFLQVARTVSGNFSNEAEVCG